MTFTKTLRALAKMGKAAQMALVATSLTTLLAAPSFAQEASIRKNLQERLPTFSKIDEVSKTPMNGLFEIRVNGSEIFYTDAEGNFLIQGILFDTKAKRNLTEERVQKLSAIDFDALPVKDAFTVVRGNGKRKLAVFSDPNCGFCKRIERDLLKVDNVTVHMFLYPLLGADSIEKSRNIWCAKDKAKAWNDWMLRDQPPPAASCDSTAVTRNVELGHKYKITGTPTLFFANGSRVPGAINAQQIEKFLADAK